MLLEFHKYFASEAKFPCCQSLYVVCKTRNVTCTETVLDLFLFFSQKRRRRIDRSMIGEPTNFVHTTHVGSGDMGMGLPSVDLVQAQMKSKGGYSHGGSEGSQL